MNDKILLQLMDAFRNEPLSDRGAIISLMLIAWYKASQNAKCPEGLRMINCTGIDADEFVLLMLKLSEVLDDHAYIVEEPYIFRLKQSTINVAINICLNLGSSGLLKDFDPTDIATLFFEKELTFPEELCDFIIGLAGDIQNKAVYLPWESRGQLTGRVLKSGAKGVIESNGYSKLPELISAILNNKINIKVSHNDLLSNPYYVENGKLIEFPVTIAPLPFGVNVDQDVVERDLYNRFNEKTRSLTVLAIRHILAQTKGRAIVTATNSLLFSSGPERNLREDLLQKKQIEAVISMPPGLLNNTNISFALLILNTEKESNSVKFVNADIDQFKVEISRTKSRLININKLIETVLTSPDNDYVKNVSTDEIIANDAQLQVSRYALNEKEQKVAKLLDSMLRKKLEDIAVLIKPLSNFNDENGIKISEVGASDLPDYGYIRSATKQIFVAEKFIKNQKQFLRPDDIVLIIKGTLGKVGIVPSDVPIAGKGGWIAGQSAAVIRVNKSSGIDPRALFMLLRSELGKELVKKLASGAAIPFVQLRELQQLSIPIPTDEESNIAIKALMEVEALQNQINELQRLQALLTANCWSLKDNENIGF